MIHAMFPPGTMVAGRFRLDELVAEGGMGVVYRATEVRERDGQRREIRPVAVKLIHPRHGTDKTYLARFERESDTVAGLQHPNIVPVLDAGEWEGRPYLVLAWIAGEDLGARIARVGPLSITETLRILTPVADALDAAHDGGLVHRDVKPGNILLGRRDEVYLTDFGLARPGTGLSAPTLPGSALMATAPFVAPEQLRPRTIRSELARRIDVYALACVAHACLTKEGPFQRDSEEATLIAHLDDPPPRITERRPDLPGAVDDVLLRALAKDPALRYASAGEFVAALREASHAPVVATDTVAEEKPEQRDRTREVDLDVAPPPPPARRRSWLPLAAAAGGLLLILLAVRLASSGGPGTSALPTIAGDLPTLAPATPPPVTPEPVTPEPVTPEPVTPSPSAEPTYNSQQLALLSMLPDTVSDCVPRDLLGGEIAAFVCAVEGSDYAEFSLYDDSSVMWDEEWTSFVEELEIAPDSGDCASGDTGEHEWWFERDPEDIRGRMLCYSGSDGAWWIQWIDVHNLVWAGLSRRDGDVTATWDAWNGALIR